MTLISNTTNFSYPILVGDILTTSGFVEEELELPTFLKGINDLLPNEQSLIPYKLRQKIYVVNDLLAVGLAGYEYYMKTFLDDLKSNFKYRELNYNNFDEFIKNYDFSEVKNCEALILFAEKKPEGILIHQRIIGNWKTAKSEGLEYIIAGGSGSNDYLDIATEPTFYGHGVDPNPLYRAISLNYMV